MTAWKLIEQKRKMGASNTSLLQEALTHCNKALEITPGEFSALNYKGIILKRLGRYDEAVEVAERAVAIPGDRYSAWGNLGAYYAIKGDIEKAEDALRTSAQLADNVKEGDRRHRAMAWSNLAALELHLGRETAVGLVSQAIDFDNENYDARILIARAWLSGSDDPSWKRAVRYAGLADAFRKGKDARCKRILAIALLRTGDWTGAIEQAQIAIKKGDIRTVNDLVISTAHAGLGDDVRARAALQRAMDAWPEDLVSDGAFRASYDNGVLWFDSATELNRLRVEAEQATQTLQTPTQTP